MPSKYLTRGNVDLGISPKLGLGKHFFTVEMYNENGGLMGDIYHAAEFIVADAKFDSMGSWSGLLAIDHSWD